MFTFESIHAILTDIDLTSFKLLCRQVVVDYNLGKMDNMHDQHTKFNAAIILIYELRGRVYKLFYNHIFVDNTSNNNKGKSLIQSLVSEFTSKWIGPIFCLKHSTVGHCYTLFSQYLFNTWIQPTAAYRNFTHVYMDQPVW